MDPSGVSGAEPQQIHTHTDVTYYTRSTHTYRIYTLGYALSIPRRAVHTLCRVPHPRSPAPRRTSISVQYTDHGSTRTETTLHGDNTAVNYTLHYLLTTADRGLCGGDRDRRQ